MSGIRYAVLAMVMAGCVGGFGAAHAASAEEPLGTPLQQPQGASVLDPTQTYEVFFSLHPQEIDRLSNVRIVGISTIGSKTFLRFQTILNNQREDGIIDLQSVSAVFPVAHSLVITSEVVLDRQVLNQKQVKEVRSETVREIFRQGQPPPMPAQHD